MKLPLLLTLSLALLSPLVSAQEIELLARDGESGDFFGVSVAISGNTAIVGADGYDSGSNLQQSGSAYLFNATTGQWITTLTASDGEDSDFFGCSVSIDGTNAIVGASGCESAYLFDITTGAELAKFTADDSVYDRSFGLSVAISGNMAVVGAPHDNNNGGGVNTGCAYLFNTTTRQQIAKLTASDLAEWDKFGQSVSISGTTVIVGAYGDDDNGDGSGSAYLFDATTGQQITKLLAADGLMNDSFGQSVAINGNTAIVGAPGPGRAYLFDITSPNTPIEDDSDTLAANDGTGAYFGRSVAISGTTAIVGAYRDDDNGADSGSAYLFSTTTGSQTGKLLSSDGISGDQFGWSVAISGTTAVVGARHHDDNGSNSGSAYRYAPGATFGAQDIISTEAEHGYSVYATDIDGDGDQDVLSASAYDDEIAWYENLGASSFGQQQLISTTADYARSVYATDLDGDGDPDVVSASGFDDKIAWYENDGAGSFSTEKVLSTDANNAFSVYAVDLNGDGLPDVLSASEGDHKIACYMNLGGGAFDNQPIVISTDVAGARSVYAADLDSDGDIDVMAAAYSSDEIVWFKNQGAGVFAPYRDGAGFDGSGAASWRT